MKTLITEKHYSFMNTAFQHTVRTASHMKHVGGRIMVWTSFAASQPGWSVFIAVSELKLKRK